MGNLSSALVSGTNNSPNIFAALSALSLATASEEMQRRAVGLAGITKLAIEVDLKARQAGTNFEEQVDVWLSTYDSPHTKRAYKSAVGRLIEWMRGKKIAPFSLTPAQADRFAAFVRGELSASGANMAINACSALYATLSKWELIGRAPFIRVKRARGQVAKRRIPSPLTMQVVIHKAKQAGRGSVADAMRVMLATGLRVGALPTLTTDGKQYWGESKGKAISPRPIPSEIADIDLQQWRGKTSASIGVAVGRELPAGAHSIRHRYAIDLYRASGNDPMVVMRALNHTNLAITTAYLAELGSD